jgi:hypothetical protein
VGSTAWDNFFQLEDSVSMSEESDSTFAAHMKALLTDYKPLRGKTAEPSCAEEWCERIADSLRHRTSDQGQLALRVAATMLKVDIVLHSATQSAPCSKRRKGAKGAAVDWDCSMEVVRYIPLMFGEEENGERMTVRLGLTADADVAVGHYYAFVPRSGDSQQDVTGAKSPQILEIEEAGKSALTGVQGHYGAHCPIRHDHRLHSIQVHVCGPQAPTLAEASRHTLA